jgi:F-type H+-transporting ATPase subunit a
VSGQYSELPLFRLNKEAPFSSFLPRNTPLILCPLLRIVEIIRTLIQPFTLALRLIVNIRAGHLILSLVCKAPLLRVLTVGPFLATLEVLVRIVQSFVFFILIKVYLEGRKR